MRRVLLVEDDATLGASLRDRLAQDYEVVWARSVAETERVLTGNQWDLAILDVGLPDGDGFEVAQKISERGRCPFLFLTAQADAQNRLKGFEIGAEEFIPKPFYLKELLLRVRHVLDSHASANILKIQNGEIHFHDFSIRKTDGAIDYPPITDMKILKFLIEQKSRIVSRDEILDQVWGVDKVPNHRTVDNAIVRLRQVLGADGERIRSVRGVGYQWVVQTEETQ